MRTGLFQGEEIRVQTVKGCGVCLDLREEWVINESRRRRREAYIL